MGFQPRIYIKNKRSRLAAIAGVLFVLAGLGTWISGQYRIGRLDVLIERYDEPITDYADTVGAAAPESAEADLLSGCKQAQIGTWLQTTDALQFQDPVSGNRVQVRLEQGKDFIDLNGRELSSCVQDEVENQQFDIGSMTNTWAFSAGLLGLALCGLAWYWNRRRVYPAGPAGPANL